VSLAGGGGPRRILAAWDASPASVSAAEAVAELAAELAAGARLDLEALFVEDESLLRFAAAAHSWHADLLSGTLRQASAADLEQQMRAQQGRTRAALERAARRTEVARWSFRVVRGQVDAEILSAAGRDLVVGHVDRPRPRGHRHHPAAELLLGLAEGGDVLLIAPRLPLGSLVLLERAATAEAVLARLRAHLNLG
jgi:hypothetical protein